MSKFPPTKTIPVADLIPYARNARTHSEEQVMKIAASIKEFGFLNPVIVDGKNGIIAGHGRLLAAKKVGLDVVPCIDASHLTEAQKKAYILADNRLALDAGWDNDLLKIELGDLNADGFDLALTGFSLDEIDGFLSDPTEGLTDPDDVPETPANPVTVPGDVWILGRHRIVCGDSTSADDVAKLMSGNVADLCFTSPPYAQQRDYKKEISDWDALMNGVFSILPVKAGAQVLVNLGLVHEKGRVNPYWDKWLDFMDENGWPLFGWYVWDQGPGMPGNWNGRLAPSHEFVFHFSKSKGAQANKWVEKGEKYIGRREKKGMRKADGKVGRWSNPGASLQTSKVADSVIRVMRHKARNMDTTHPAMFPVSLCEYIYNSFAKAGDWIYEPFSGSGTSIIACEQFGANCAAMELAPEYVDISVNRWQKFTGQNATLEATGATFSEIETDRSKAVA